MLAGEPTGMSVPGRMAQELMPGEPKGATSTGVSPYSSGPSTEVGKQTTLSQRVFEQGTIAAKPTQGESNQNGYQGYVRRYFQPEKQ